MITIAAKQLAQLAMPDACPRCFWLQKHAGRMLPFQRFPSVFTHLDQASKNVLTHYLSMGMTPPWFKAYFDLTAQIKPPHWSKFSFTNDGLQVRGEADFIAKISAPINDCLFIGDFKTAFVTDKMMPLYTAQLGCYALAAEAIPMGPVDSLGVIFCQPQSGGSTENMEGQHGFRVQFDCQVVLVDRNDSAIFELCARAVHILSNPIPAPTASCEDCIKLAGLQAILSTGVVP